MNSAFSADGKYFAQLTHDGKLKVWNTNSNVLEQEYVPEYHLASPCTCLKFIDMQKKTPRNSDGSSTPKRTKKVSLTSPYILLGSTSGLLMLYGIAEAKLHSSIDSDTGENIHCVTSSRDSTVYTGGDFHIVEFSLVKKAVSTKWKAGKERTTAIIVNEDRSKLLSAAKSIKLWNLRTKEVVRTFTGHKFEIVYLNFLTDVYFLSGSKNDRLVNCWNLSANFHESNAVVSFLLAETIQNVGIIASSQGHFKLAVTARSGIVHVFQHTLNGKSSKPIKPKTTLQVVAETTESNKSISPIHIAGSLFRDEQTLCICYGSEIMLTFENIPLNLSDKVQCLVRRDLGKAKAAEGVDNSKTKLPIIGNDVSYLTPQFSGGAVGGKRKIDGQKKKGDVPLEQRLENLKLNQLVGGAKVPRSNNVAQLLLQGLHSKDEAILRTVLCKRDEETIQNTLLRLPLQVIPALVEKLTDLLRGKTGNSQIGILWLKCLLQTHVSLLLNNPNLVELLKPILGSLDNRLRLQNSFCKFKGRLEALVGYIGIDGSQDSHCDDPPLLTFTDRDSNDSDFDPMDSEEELVEEQEDGNEVEMNGGLSASDSNLSENDLTEGEISD